MRGYEPGGVRRSGAVLVLVLALVGVLAILGIGLLLSSQEGYNQAAVAVVGQRADLLARSAVDEARDALNAWMARWPGRVPAGAALDPSSELAKKLKAGEAWSEGLAAFGGVNLIDRSARAIAAEGFAIDEASVRFHAFHRAVTAPGGAPVFYGLPDDPAPPIDEFRGFVTFKVSLRAERSRSPIRRTFAATHDVVLADMIPWAGAFALFSYLPVPGAGRVMDQLKKLPPEAERTGPAWKDLNEGGGLRVFASGGRVFVIGPFLVSSTGSATGSAPEGENAGGTFGPGRPGDAIWQADTYVGWGGTPAPRAGLVKPTTSTFGLEVGIAPNARPLEAVAVWNALFPGDRARDPGIMMPKPQIWFGEHRNRKGPDRTDRERQGFSIVGDPGNDMFRPFTGRLVRFPDDANGAVEDLELIEPDLDEPPGRAWGSKNELVRAELAKLDEVRTGAFFANREGLIDYKKRRFAVLPEGRLFGLYRWGRFETPLWVTIAKASYPALLAASVVLGGPAAVLITAGALSPLALLAMMEAYQVGHLCVPRSDAPPLGDPGKKPEDEFGVWVTAGFFAVREAASFNACLSGFQTDNMVMPDEAVYPFGAHFQPIVIPDPQVEFWTDLAIGVGAVVTLGFFPALVTLTPMLPIVATVAASAPNVAELVQPSAGPANHDAAARVDAASTLPPCFRDVRGLVTRTHETLDDALQDARDAAGQPVKVLLLNGVLRVKKLRNMVPFRYAGRGIVLSDDAGEDGPPLLTGPILPVDFDPARPSLTHHLTVVHLRELDAGAVAQGRAAVRLAAGPPGSETVAMTPQDLAPTSAVFKMTLVALEGARPADGTPRAVILGNYVCGLPNKSKIPEASELHVWWDPALKVPTPCPVAAIGPRAIQVSR